MRWAALRALLLASSAAISAGLLTCFLLRCCDDVFGWYGRFRGSAAASSYGSGLIGGVLDAVIGPVMANVQYGRGKHVSNRQMKAVQFLAENQPSYAVEGLRRAGLNPLLSVMHGIAQPAQAARVDSRTFGRGLFPSRWRGA